MQRLSQKNIIPIIMCGGSGTRLWPMSRKSLPKQYLKCNPQSKNSFLQDTYLRIKNIEKLQDPILICNKEHRFIAAEQMREIGVRPKDIVLEPFGRNTAAAIALGAITAESDWKNSILLALPADHAVKNIEKFIQVLNKGIDYAEKDYIVTFGIPPTYAESGFGYIEARSPLNADNLEGISITKFIEKPEQEIAQKLILDNKYSWNSGIFLMKAEVVVENFKKFARDIFFNCQQSIKKSRPDLDFLRINEDIFRNCPNKSFDKAIMEKTKSGIVLLLDSGWSDVGSWDSLWDISNKDKHGNSLIGNVLNNEIRNCYVRSESKLVVGIDIEDLIIIETSDAILVSQKCASQKVKNLVELMKSKNFKEATSHQKIYRPWGSYTSIAKGEGWQVKKIHVKPGESLSLQKHLYRTEHWVVVAGEALVEVGETKKILSKNESTYIPLGCKHRLSNKGSKTLVIIEVQSGTYLNEDDITRYQDNYGRINKF